MSDQTAAHIRRPASNTVLRHLVSGLMSSQLCTDPWPYCYLRQGLPKSVAEDVANTFHKFNLEPVSSSRPEKKYHMRTQRLNLEDETETSSAAWRPLILALMDDRYRDALGSLAGQSLRDARLTIDLWEYQDGDWLAPHVDKPEKVVTQLFYFSKNWTPAAGGHLLVLDGPDPSHRPIERLEPTTGASTVLVRSDSSWHAVEAAHGASRCSIAVTFWRS